MAGKRQIERCAGARGDAAGNEMKVKATATSIEQEMSNAIGSPVRSAFEATFKMTEGGARSRQKGLARNA